jgi:hypothetical protein
MKLTLDPMWVRSASVAKNPTALGILVHLSALVVGIQRVVDGVTVSPLAIHLSPAALADTLSIPRSRVEDSITKLAQHRVIDVDKKTISKRGIWEISLSPIADMLEDGAVVPDVKAVPLRDLMREWTEAYRSTVGYAYMRSQRDYFREKNDWVSLYQEHGDNLFEAMDKFFKDIRYSQWGYAFSVFFKAAGKLCCEETQRGWEVK